MRASHACQRPRGQPFTTCWGARRSALPAPHRQSLRRLQLDRLRFRGWRPLGVACLHAPAGSAQGASTHDGAGELANFSWRSPDRQWLVRPIRPTEVAAVAAIQAQAFHRPSAFGPLDTLLFYTFQGEVLAGLQQKLKYTERDCTFCCLVAESAAQPGALAGVVEVSLQGEEEEVAALRGRGLQDDSYAYVACMAVARSERRHGMASALLAAAERVAGKWAQNWVLLHVYCDNFPAQRLYHRNRYVDLHTDPEAQGPLSLMGRKRRVLMAKGAAMFTGSSPFLSIGTNLLERLQELPAR